MNTKYHFVSAKDYKGFAGPDWPSYQQFQQGFVSKDPKIQAEIHNFLAMMQQTFEEIDPDMDQLSLANQQRQQQQFFDKNYQGTACTVPWNTLGINANGHAFICSSPSWVPIFVGNILTEPDIWAVLNSEKAQKIRQEINSGRYYYCNHNLCSFFRLVPSQHYVRSPPVVSEPLSFEPNPEYQISDIPQNLIFDFDYTCNFRCPSCRIDVINNNKHHVIRPINDRIVSKIKTEIIDRIGSKPVNIRWAGGEPFISEPYLELLTYITGTGKHNISHTIQTNGSYLKNKQHLLQWLLPYVTELRISFDAATEQTYAKTRTGGVWKTLLENVQWIKHFIKINQFQTRISADFVVQKNNYQEIPEFEELCKDLDISMIRYQKMWNWGTWPESEFHDHNVYHHSHSEYLKLVEILRSVGRKVL